MALLAGFDIGLTSAWVALDEDTGEIAGWGEARFERDAQLWHCHDVAMAAVRALREVARDRGTEVLACMFESEFISKNPRVAIGLARRRGHLELAAIRCLGPVLADARPAAQLRRQLQLPRGKQDAHDALLRRFPECAPLTEHARDAFVAARVLFDTEFITTAADAV